MQSYVQNITTVRYLLDLYEPTYTRMQTSTDLTATKLIFPNRV